jgi:hypothetical protein
MIHLLNFWQRPLRCVFGFHKFRPHPGGISWKVCDACYGEKEVR